MERNNHARSSEFEGDRLDERNRRVPQEVPVRQKGNQGSCSGSGVISAGIWLTVHGHIQSKSATS